MCRTRTSDVRLWFTKAGDLPAGCGEGGSQLKFSSLLEPLIAWEVYGLGALTNG